MPLSPSSDEVLIGTYYECDDDAFATLYRRYYRELVANFRRLGFGDRSEDLAEEVFLRVIQTKVTGNGRFDPSKAGFRTWLRRIKMNLAIEVWRRRGLQIVELDAEQEGEGADQFPAEELNPEEILHARETSGAVIDCLNRLPPDQRVVLLLSDVEGLTLSEITALLHITYGGAATRLWRARRDFRRCLESKGNRIVPRGTPLPTGARIILVFPEDDEMLIYGSRQGGE